MTVEMHWREWGAGLGIYPWAVYVWIGPATLRIPVRSIRA